jgi:hypothetical protein
MEPSLAKLVSKLVEISLHCMESECSFPCSQELSTCPYSKPNQFNPSSLPISLRSITSSSCLSLGLSSDVFSQFSPPKSSSLPHTCHMPCLSHSSLPDHQGNLGFVVPCIFKYSNKTSNQMQQSIVTFIA